jgi:phosphatidylglycerophosphate synthase
VTESSTPSRAEYRAQDRALLLGFYQRLLWNRLVETLPRRLTPNTITLFGESCAVLAAVATAFAARGHPALYLLSALLLFTYMTGDNVDGPHARRTGQTSALGEFLDHGLDGLASAAVLLCSAFAMRIDGWAMFVLLALGSVGFFATFWAQFRTGLLVTPQLSAMEGVTGAALFQVLIFALGEPAWLRLPSHGLNLATFILAALAVSYLYAIASPLLRARREHVGLGDLGWLSLVVATQAWLVARGSSALAPSLTVAVVVAELVSRMIVLRRREAGTSLFTPLHVVPAVPALFATIAVTQRFVTLASIASLALATAMYLRTFAVGVREFRSVRGH